MTTLYWVLKRLRPDVIHFQWTVLPAIDRQFMRRLRAIAPCVLTVHDTNAFLAPSSQLQRVGWLTILSAFDHLVVHTQAGKQALIANGLKERNISIIPHGVFDCPMGQDNNTCGEPPPGTCVLLAFGSIKPYKGIDILIRALAQVPADARRSIRLVIAGNPGTSEAELRSLSVECGVADSIEWILRFVDDDEIPFLFHRSHVVVFPYREIDASGALMTALPYGKAIIASRLGLFAELLKDGETALLVDPACPNTLSAAITAVVNDPKSAAEMGRRSARLAGDVLNWAHIAELTQKTYDKARHVL